MEIYITITLNFNHFSLKGIKLEWFLCLCLIFFSFFFFNSNKVGKSKHVYYIIFLNFTAPKCAMRTSYYYIWVKNIGEAGLLC